MKRSTILGLLAIELLCGCSRPKNTVLPTDPSKWGDISESVKKLDDADRKELAGYMMRMSVASVFGGSKAAAIPPGTTIGDAIKDQKDFEAKQQADEAQADILKAKVAAEHNAQAAKINQSATVALTGLDVLPENIQAGRFSARLSMTIAVQNHTPKAISGIKGAFVFKDQFGADITSINMSMDEDVSANADRVITGYGKDLNQFEATDNKLSTIPFSKMHVTWDPQMVIFADGSKIAAPDASGQ